MYENLEIFRMSQALAKHSSIRQGQIAANVANADTPGFKANDVASFADVYNPRRDVASLRGTRTGHFETVSLRPSGIQPVTQPGTADPNGNTVSLETEMIKAVETKHAHDAALSVYDSARSILRTALGRGR